MKNVILDKSNYYSVLAVFLVSMLNPLVSKAGFLPDISFPDLSLPDKGLIEFIESGPSWAPKPYKIPIDQGSLVNEENLKRLIPGLSKEQVKFLLGSPAIIDSFHSNRWDYVYYDRIDGKLSKPKRLVVIFKNEKVSEIYDQHKLVNKIGLDMPNGFSDAPILEKGGNQSEMLYQEIVIARREDFLSLRKNNNLPVCLDDDFESYDAQKTLFAADEDTLEVRSDKQNQSEDGIFYASGNVEIERANDLIKADEAEFNADTGVLEAKNNVKYLTKGLTLYSEEGGYNSQANTVSFKTTTYNFPEQDHPGRGKADDIFIDSKGIVYLNKSSYTTCSLNSPDWELSSSKTELIRESDRGHAYNLVLKYKSIPVLYSPFLSFPLSKERHSGFLFPSIGSSGESGTVISQPYYFNIRENLDFTFTPTNFSGRGKMFEGEIRHKADFSDTVFEVANLDKDDIFKKSRHAYFFRDQRLLKDTLKLSNNKWSGSHMKSEISLGGVSDIRYFDDFGSTLSRVGRTHILREAKIKRKDYGAFGIIDTSISTQGYQVAKSGLAEQYKTLPKINITYASNKVNKEFLYGFSGEIAHFDHTLPTQPTGSRISIYPSIQYPIRTAGWELIPKLGFKYTDYNLTGNSRNKITRSTSIFSLYGRMVFEKQQSNNILQTLEPQMYLLHIPVGNQDDIPLFDTGEDDFKYTLFRENKFYGEDRLNDAKQITLALTSKIIDTSSGTELIRGTIGQIFHFDDRDVNLEAGVENHSDSSNLMGLVTARFDEYWRITGYSEFNPHAGHGDKNQIRLSYKQPYGKQYKIFNSSYRFARGTQEEIDVSGVYPLNGKLALVGKFNYSFNNKRSNTEDTLEKMIGFEYESCCYGLKFVLRDYWNGTKTDNAFFFEFLPKGLATSDNKTSELLKEGILGYQDKFNY